MAILALPASAGRRVPSTFVQSAVRPAGGAWESPRAVSRAAPPSDYLSYPRVAVDASGNAVAVWWRFDGRHYVVQAAVRPAHGVWKAPTNLSAATVNSFNPDVALDAAGDAVVVWARDDGKDYRVQSTVRPAGGVWSAASTISATSRRYPSEPHVAVDAGGNAVAVWHRFANPGVLVEAAVRPAAGAWGAAQALFGEPLPEGSFENPWPQVAIDPAGNAVAVWQRIGATAAHGVSASVRPAGGVWEAEQEISPDMPDLCAGAEGCAPLPQVVAGPSGAVAVWTDYQYTGEFIKVAARPPGGSWGVPENVSAPEDLPEEPEIALDPAGDLAAVWVTTRFSDQDVEHVVRVATRPAGGAWSTPRDLSGARGHALLPQVALDAGGDAVAVWSWSRTFSTSSTVQTSARPAAGGWSPTQSLATATEPAVAQVAVDPAGDAVAVWSAFPPCVVPQVVGKTLAAAKLAIARGHCLTGRIGSGYSARFSRGRVLSQQPAPGTKLKNLGFVRLVVSRGPRSR